MHPRFLFLLFFLVIPFSFLSARTRIHLDYQIGFLGGYRPFNLTQENPASNAIKGIPTNTQSQRTWQIGGFLGLGTVIQNKFPSATGLEYTVLFISQDSDASALGQVSSLDLTFRAEQKDTAIEHYLDAYYKIGLSRIPAFPVDWQINLGAGIRHHLTSKAILEISPLSPPTQTSHTPQELGFGLHVGTRISLQFLFVGVDYLFIPNWASSSGYYENNAPLGSHSLSLNLGIIISEGFFRSFSKNHSKRRI